MVKKIKKKTKRTKRTKRKGGAPTWTPSAPVTGLPPGVPGEKMFSMYDSEQLNRLIARSVEREGLQDINDIEAFLRKNFFGRNLDDLLLKEEFDPVEEAQRLAFQALESQDPREIVFCVKRALELDPECLDAQSLNLQILLCDSGEELIEALSELVKTAEQRMGEDYLEEHRGHFWGMTETRPYMRLLNTLFNELVKAGRDREAIECGEKMLDLNPNDNQGMRTPLCGLYLMRSDLEGARRLLDQYPEEMLAAWNWAKTLERFLSGDLEGAGQARKKAERQNPHVLAYLTGQKQPPSAPLYGFSPGDESEAIYCFDELGPAFRAHPEAMKWLKGK